MAILATVPRQSRQGVITTPSIVLQPGASELLVKLNVTSAVYNAVGRSVRMLLYWLDGEGIWRLTSSAMWQSGPYTDRETGEVNPAQVLSPSIVGLEGKTIRAEFEIPISMSVGATIETLP